MEHIGKKIKILRAWKGITQDELSEKVHKTRSLLSHIEKTGKVNAYTLEKIIEALGMSKAEFDNFDPSCNVIRSAAKDKGSEMGLLRERLTISIKENRVLKELVLMQRKLIVLMEKAGRER